MLTANVQKLFEVMEEPNKELSLSPQEVVLLKEALKLYLDWHHPLFEDITHKKMILMSIMARLIENKEEK